ncbi:Metallo-dependent phosphatase-like protein [Schizophyllum commune]
MPSGRHVVVQALKIVWVFSVFYFELWTFYRHAGSCEWPDSRQDRADDAEHVLLVADPQVLDMNSYPDRHPALQWLSQVIVDLNLRKNWRAALRSRPDKVVFLGDMLDNGRMDMTDEEYSAYHRRFRRVFQGSGTTPTYYIPGNHDIGLGEPSAYSRSTQADERYVAHFGSPNKIVHAGGHALVMIDAPSLVDEDHERISLGRTFDEWPFPPNGTMSFAKNIPRDIDDATPRILLTHIPLHRPPKRGCGPLRERGTIRAGHGGGYENTIGREASQMLLEAIKPTYIFSGDDHDYCEYTHHYSGRTAQEITVKSLSMAMGVRRPGYQLLSLAPTDRGSEGAAVAATTLCLLPDQLHIYLGVYVPLLVLSLALLGVLNALARYRRRSSHSSDRPWRRTSITHPFLREDDDALPAPASLTSSRRPTRLGRQRSSPGPGRSPPSYAAPLKRALKTTLMGARPGRQRTPTRDILYDIRDVAILPILLFCLITWWTMAY